MSTPRSDRAEGGVRDLTVDMLGWLRDHQPLTDRLELVDSVDDGASVIMPAIDINAQHRSDRGDPPDVAVGVDPFSGTASRENRQTRKTHTGQTDLQIRERTLNRHGGVWVHEIHDEIVAVLTEHREGWYTASVAGSSEEPKWDENINRWRQIATFNITSWG